MLETGKGTRLRPVVQLLPLRGSTLQHVPLGAAHELIMSQPIKPLILSSLNKHPRALLNLTGIARVDYQSGVHGYRTRNFP